MAATMPTGGITAGTTEGTDRKSDSSVEAEAPTINDAISKYRPARVTDSMWRKVAGDVQAAVRISAPPGASEAQKRAAVAARLACWAAKRAMSTAPSVLYTHHTVERFIAEGCAGLSEPSLASYRSRLRRIGEKVNPNGGWPGSPQKFSRRTTKPPYTASEVRLLSGLPNAQTTPLRAARLQVVLAGGLGAGLDSRDLHHLLPRHVELRDGLAVLKVSGHRPRIVAVLAEYTPMLIEGLELITSDRVFTASRNAVNRFVSSVNGDPAVPHLDPARLRSTWLVTQMTRRVPLGVLLDAAGLAGANSLADLIAHVSRPDQVSALRLLAGFEGDL